ncbi:hypothetical protein BJY01DRAFT_65889 [Aspergillus pseudoustus]|uniref:Uncharacterized protein n=1 Tax=Aspergillus pseudoustus TaxID=1810923 RepID=A0ABR4J9V7_9EURO
MYLSDIKKVEADFVRPCTTLLSTQLPEEPCSSSFDSILPPSLQPRIPSATRVTMPDTSEPSPKSKQQPLAMDTASGSSDSAWNLAQAMIQGWPLCVMHVCLLCPPRPPQEQRRSFLRSNLTPVVAV